MSTSSARFRFLLLLGISLTGHLWPLLGSHSTELLVIPAQEGEISIEVRLSAASVASSAAPAPNNEAAEEPVIEPPPIESVATPEPVPVATQVPPLVHAIDPREVPTSQAIEEVTQSARQLLETARAAWKAHQVPDASLVPELADPSEPVAVAPTDDLEQEVIDTEKKEAERPTPTTTASQVEPPTIPRQEPAVPPSPQDSPQPKEKVDSPAASQEQAAAQSAKPKPVGVRSEARLLGRAMPSYPVEAQRRGIEGTVVLRLHVTQDGVVDVATIERSAGSTLLDDAALDFARSIRLTPARLDDQPVETVLRLPVTFRLVAP